LRKITAGGLIAMELGHANSALLAIRRNSMTAWIGEKVLIQFRIYAIV
jgi:hypothetical protein